jgi:hypothetical protein
MCVLREAAHPLTARESAGGRQRRIVWDISNKVAAVAVISPRSVSTVVILPLKENHPFSHSSWISFLPNSRPCSFRRRKLIHVLCCRPSFSASVRYHTIRQSLVLNKIFWPVTPQRVQPNSSILLHTACEVILAPASYATRRQFLDIIIPTSAISKFKT